MPEALHEVRRRMAATLFEMRLAKERADRLLNRMEAACADLVDVLEAHHGLIPKSSRLDSEMIEE